MSCQPDPVRPNKDPAMQPGPECEVNGVDEDDDAPEDERAPLRSVD